MATSADGAQTVAGANGALGRLPRRMVGGLAAVLSSLALMAVLLLLLGADPWTALSALLDGALGNKFGITETIVITSILALTGLAAAIPFSAGLWNVGGEGQLYVGAFAAAAGAFVFADHLPHVIGAAVAVLLATIAGGLWALIPGVLKARYNANEVIITLMLVFVGMFLVDYGIGSLWSGGVSRATRPIPESSELPIIWTGTSLNAGVLLALAAVAVGWFVMARTTLGFKINATGKNPHSAEISGLRVGRLRVTAFVLGGAFAGIAGAIAVLGISRALVAGFSDNFGFIGVAVALLARLNPLWIIPSAALFAVLRVGSNKMQVTTGLSPSIGEAIVAVFVISLLAFHLLGLRRISGSVNE